MRYREDQVFNQDQPAIVANGFPDVTVAFTLIVGIIFIAMGRFGKQWWVIFWGVITVLAAIFYAVIRWFNLF